MHRLPFFATIGLLAALSPVVRAADEQTPNARWSNPADTPLTVTLDELPPRPILLRMDAQGRPFRILPALPDGGALRFTLPPNSSAELFDRQTLAGEMTPFSTAARWGAMPRIIVGPLVPRLGAPEVVDAPWSQAAGRFHAYPNADISVSVQVRNDGLGTWTNPRVELFAPDDWVVEPRVAEVLTEARTAASTDAPSISAGRRGVLPPTVAGIATFKVRIPEEARTGFTWPLVAFFRFNTAGETLTVQNSVDVNVEQPARLRFGMNEAGTKFITSIESLFPPAPLGPAAASITSPPGTAWTFSESTPVEFRTIGNITSNVRIEAPGDARVQVPVTVRVAGSVLRAEPVVYAAARYDGGVSVHGLRTLGDRGEILPMGLRFPETGSLRTIRFEVGPDFAVADPAVFVSPTWVTVTVENRGATRARLEFDAFGSTSPAVAADVPIPASSGRVTLSFLLPDARFAHGLPGGADFQLTVNGDALLQRVTVSKWNPEKTH